MKFQLSNLWRWSGEIDRGPYALIGVIGFALKHNLDRLVASAVFHRPWGIFNYWIPAGQALRITSLSRRDAEFFATLVALALPFIWIGVVLTVQRLRSIGLPVWLAVVFFLPVINLLFFLVLSILPAQQKSVPQPPVRAKVTGPFLGRLIPDNPVGSAAVAVLLIGLLGAGATLLSTRAFVSYGWGLFVALPFCVGLASVLVYGYHGPRGFGSCVSVALLAAVFLGALLLAVAVEGVVCLVMAMPLGLALAFMGGVVGYAVQRHRPAMRAAPSSLMLLLAFVPGWTTVERLAPPPAPTFAVRTSVDIDAPPEAVWKEVIAFSPIPAPTEALFRLGIAYPTRATISGRGVGAERHCEFDTGAFVEPIEVWDEPRLLKFSVASNPPPMQEWTPYKEIHPAHLSGFLVAREGEFLLVPLPDGRTRLEGTTWYQHHLWPATYWQLWSDAIIHRIHLRVLRHIKRRAEANAPAPPTH